MRTWHFLQLILSALVLAFLSLWVEEAKAGWFVDGFCYQNQTEAGRAFVATFPSMDQGVRVMVDPSVPITFSGNYVNATVNIFNITTGNSNTTNYNFYLAPCDAPIVGSDQYQDAQMNLYLASMVAAMGATSSVPATTNTTYPMDKIAMIIACCLMFGIGYTGGRTL